MKYTRHFFAAILVCFCLPLAAEQEVVKASAFGFSPEDATVCLQKAIDSGAKTVIVDHVGSDWLVRPITLRSNLELVIGENVTLRAKPGEFKGMGDCLLNCVDLDNVTIRGTRNSRLYMPKKDYQDASRYTPSEWRHAISCFGCTNFTLKDLTIDGSGGDGMDVNRSRKRSKSKDVCVENVTFINHHRLALAASSAENFLVKNCRMLNTSGTAPQAGFDFEPNKPDESVVNVRFVDCRFAGNASSGIAFVLTPSNATSPAASVFFENCIIEDNGTGLYWAECPFRPSNLVLKNCVFRRNRGRALFFSNLQQGMSKATLSGCRIETSASTAHPIEFSTNLIYENPFGDIDFGNLQITDTVKRSPFKPIAIQCGLSSRITGDISVIHDGQSQAFDLPAFIKVNPPAPIELRTFKTTNFFTDDYDLAHDKPGEMTAPLTLRGPSHIIQWLRPGVPLEVRFKLIPENRDLLTAQVDVLDANNGIVEQFSFSGTEEKIYRFPPMSHPTMRQFKINPRQHAVHFFSNAPGHGILANNRMHICEMDADLFFIVPKDATEVKVEVTGQEPLCAALFNVMGDKVMDYNEPFSDTRILMGKRQPTQHDELWKIKAYNVVEDYFLRIGAPACPVFFTSPKNALRRKAQ